MTPSTATTVHLEHLGAISWIFIRMPQEFSLGTIWRRSGITDNGLLLRHEWYRSESEFSTGTVCQNFLGHDKRAQATKKYKLTPRAKLKRFMLKS